MQELIVISPRNQRTPLAVTLYPVTQAMYIFSLSTKASILHEKMHEYLSAKNICSEKRTVFRKHSSRKTVSFEEQIMTKDKYASIFLHQMETIVPMIFHIFFTTHTALKIGEYSPGEYLVM